MKKFCFILALAAMCSCSSEENPFSNESAIRLTSEVTPMSRGTDLNQQSTQIVSGQKVGVTITGARSEHNNVAWTAGNNGEMTNTSDPIYYGDGEATITAYHPYNAAWTDISEDATFAVSTDQTGQGYLDSDLLWATVTASKTAEPVPLTFTHKLAKINVTLTSDDVADLSSATISICGTNIETVFNPQTGTVTSSESTNIRTIKAANGSTASAIIVPQTVKADTWFIQVELDGKYYHYVLPSDKEFDQGNSYSYTMKLKSTVELECISDSITDWNNENIQGEAGDADITTVALTEAGTLATALGDKMLSVDKLKVFGPLNGADIKSLRQMSACSEFSETGDLRILDLSEATIVESDDLYYNSYTTTNDKIGDYMFTGAELRKIILPNNVTAIGEYAFSGSSLSSVTIPNSVITIGNNAFQDCTLLYSVTIPNGVTTIGSYAFQDCTSLNNVTIPNGVTSIGTATFMNCRALVNLTIPSSVGSIENAAFQGCEHLINVTCLATTPPYLGTNALSQSTLNSTLRVPKGTKATYEASAWKNYFTYIDELSE